MMGRCVPTMYIACDEVRNEQPGEEAVYENGDV